MRDGVVQYGAGLGQAWDSSETKWDKSVLPWPMIRCSQSPIREPLAAQSAGKEKGQARSAVSAPARKNSTIVR